MTDTKGGPGGSAPAPRRYIIGTEPLENRLALEALLQAKRDAGRPMVHQDEFADMTDDEIKLHVADLVEDLDVADVLGKPFTEITDEDRIKVVADAKAGLRDALFGGRKMHDGQEQAFERFVSGKTLDDIERQTLQALAGLGTADPYAGSPFAGTPDAGETDEGDMTGRPSNGSPTDQEAPDQKEADSDYDKAPETDFFTPNQQPDDPTNEKDETTGDQDDPAAAPPDDDGGEIDPEGPSGHDDPQDAPTDEDGDGIIEDSDDPAPVGEVDVPADEIKIEWQPPADDADGGEDDGDEADPEPVPVDDGETGVSIPDPEKMHRRTPPDGWQPTMPDDGVTDPADPDYEFGSGAITAEPVDMKARLLGGDRPWDMETSGGGGALGGPIRHDDGVTDPPEDQMSGGGRGLEDDPIDVEERLEEEADRPPEEEGDDGGLAPVTFFADDPDLPFVGHVDRPEIDPG